MSSAPGSGPRWRAVYPGGPAKSYHVGCVVAGVLYVHGGVSQSRSTQPLRSLYALEAGVWREEGCVGAPALSHHAAVVLADRYVALIGGWDGHRRTDAVHLYDTRERRWHTCATSGFPTGAGLSSHTATLLSCGDVVIVGREGSLRTQRREGNAFSLRINVTTRRGVYARCPIGVDSRSGHTAVAVGTTLYLIGGRADRLVEFHSNVRTAAVTPCPQLARLAVIARRTSPSPKLPCGRKHHVAATASGVVFVHGGETFDGRSRGPVGEMFVLLVKPTGEWVKLADASLCRAGHVCVCLDDVITLHGGEELKTGVHGETYQLDI